MVSIYPSIHSSFQSWFFFVLFFFFAGRGYQGVQFFFFFTFFFFFKVKLLIHITFALLKYNTKRNLISVKYRLPVLCFGNIRIDVDDGHLCLGTAVWWFPLKFTHWTQGYQRVCPTILETGYRMDMYFCALFSDYRIVFIEQVTEMNNGNCDSHQRMFCSLVII